MTFPPRSAPVPGWREGAGWGWVWGDDDQIGAMNAITVESTAEALRGISQGRVFDLGLVLDRTSFVAPVHVGTEVVMFRSPDGLLRFGEFGDVPTDGVSFHTSMVVISDHAGTQVDGLCHATFGADRHWYNGYDGAKFTSDFGPKRAGAENIPPIITSAVLIDVPGHLGSDELEPSFAVGPDLLEATLASQEVDIAAGEAVFVRSGNLRHWGEVGAEHEKVAAADTSGITLEAARWLVESKGAIFIGSDTSTVEVVPPVDGDNVSPVHKYCLVDQGVHLGELHYLEELASERIYRFCYIALAPKVRGTTAGFAMRPIGVV